MVVVGDDVRSRFGPMRRRVRLLTSAPTDCCEFVRRMKYQG